MNESLSENLLSKTDKKNQLLPSDEDGCESFKESVWKITSFASNVYLAMIFQIGPQFLNMFMVASYDDNKEILEGLSISSMFVNVTGVSLATGLGAALESYGSQAYGAGNYAHVGLYLQKTVILISIMAVFCLLALQFAEPALVAMGVSATTAEYSQRYINISQLGFPFTIAAIILDFYLNAQKISQAQMWSSGICFMFYPFVAWFFISHLQWGIEGCASAMTAFSWMQFTFLFFVVKVGKFNDPRTWSGWSVDCFNEIGPYIKKSLQTLVLRSVDWWSFEILTLQIGIMANIEGRPELLAVSTLISSTMFFVYFFTIGLGAAGTSLIGNSLGEGKPRIAQRYAKLMFIVGLPLVFTAILLGNILAEPFAHAVSSDPVVQDTLIDNFILLTIMIPVDNIQGLFCGILFGLGYVGFPAGVSAFLNVFIGQVLCFMFWYWMKMQLIGAYMGMFISLGLTGCVYGICVCRTDFVKTSASIREREVEEQAVEEDASKL